MNTVCFSSFFSFFLLNTVSVAVKLFLNKFLNLALLRLPLITENSSQTNLETIWISILNHFTMLTLRGFQHARRAPLFTTLRRTYFPEIEADKPKNPEHTYTKVEESTDEFRFVERLLSSEVVPKVCAWSDTLIAWLRVFPSLWYVKGRVIRWLIDCFIERLIDWVNLRSFDWLIDWLIGWFDVFAFAQIAEKIKAVFEVMKFKQKFFICLWSKLHWGLIFLDSREIAARISDSIGLDSTGSHATPPPIFRLPDSLLEFTGIFKGRGHSCECRETVAGDESDPGRQGGRRHLGPRRGAQESHPRHRVRRSGGHAS